MYKRIFVGISVAENIQFLIKKWEEPIRSKLYCRWLDVEDLHITLVPPWYASDIGDVVKYLSSIKGKITPFELEFNRISYGPVKKKPRLIWVVGRPSREFVLLKNVVGGILNVAISKYDIPHITLARFSRKRMGGFPRIFQKINWRQKVDSLNLYESTLFDTGAKYNVLHKVSLE